MKMPKTSSQSVKEQIDIISYFLTLQMILYCKIMDNNRIAKSKKREAIVIVRVPFIES